MGNDSEILAGDLKPEPQVGEVTLFKRRNESESMIPVGLSLNEVYNFIRMLDAPGYPSSFIEGQNLRVEFTEARWADGDLVATVSVSLLKEEKNDR